MKAFTLMTLLACSPLVMAAGAQDQPVNQQESAVGEYAYGIQLDMARVVSLTDTSNVCGIVPARMIYEDSNDQKHTVEYQVRGNGRTDG